MQWAGSDHGICPWAVAYIANSEDMIRCIPDRPHRIAWKLNFPKWNGESTPVARGFKPDVV